MNKENLTPNIKVVEKNELVQNDKKIADELNTFFIETLEQDVKYVQS